MFTKGHKINLGRKRKPFTEKHKRNIQEARRKYFMLHSVWNKGLTANTDTRVKKYSENRLYSKALRKKLSLVHKGKRLSKKHREKISKTRIERKIPAWNKGKSGMQGKNNPMWKGGISRLPYPYKFNEKLKEEIRKRDKSICQICGIHQKKYYRKLDIHHIDYDKNNLKPSNLISLCSICNCIVNANRRYWKKKLHRQNDIVHFVNNTRKKRILFP